MKFDTGDLFDSRFDGRHSCRRASRDQCESSAVDIWATAQGDAVEFRGEAAQADTIGEHVVDEGYDTGRVSKDKGAFPISFQLIYSAYLVTL